MKTIRKEYVNNGCTIVLVTNVTYSFERETCGRIGNSSLTYRINGRVEIENVVVAGIELYRKGGFVSEYTPRENLSLEKRKWADDVALDKVLDDLENNNLGIEL